jgi:hypothetical protein
MTLHAASGATARVSIGGEDNVLLAVPRGKRLVFQVVVSAEGVTVRRNWPLVVR